MECLGNIESNGENALIQYRICSWIRFFSSSWKINSCSQLGWKNICLAMGLRIYMSILSMLNIYIYISLLSISSSSWSVNYNLILSIHIHINFSSQRILDIIPDENIETSFPKVLKVYITHFLLHTNQKEQTLYVPLIVIYLISLKIQILSLHHLLL